jgi:hypothetical protein
LGLPKNNHKNQDLGNANVFPESALRGDGYGSEERAKRFSLKGDWERRGWGG